MRFRQVWAIVLDTLREARSRWIFAGTALSGTVSAALLLWYIQTIASRAPHSTLTNLMQSDPRFLDNTFLARQVLASTASMALWTQVAFAITLLAGLVGPLLSAERNALIVAAPVPRPFILVARYLGLLAIALWGVAITFGEVWVAASWKFGVWHWPFLTGIGTTLLAISGCLALLVLMQTAVSSSALAIVVVTALTLLGAGAQYPDRVRVMTGSALLADATGWVGKILPRSSEIADWTAIYINSGLSVNPAPLGYTALAATGFVACAAALFARKEL